LLPSAAMEPHQLVYRNSTVGYYRFGSGPRVAICFHGFGEDATLFGFLGKYAGTQFTFYSIDLPFHGKTEWRDGLIFTVPTLSCIVEEILQQNNHKLQTTNDKLTLMGFSLGGRIALSLYQAMPEKIERLVLLAPDGLKVNFWYWFSTQTWLGNKLFLFTMKYPGWFFGFLKTMNNLRLVNASVFKFVNYYIGEKNIRQLLYNRWTTLRKLRPNLKHIKSFITQEKTAVRLIYGKHDRIILSAVGKRFKKAVESHCTLTIINSGHQVLHEKHREEIVAALLH
jgi:pimeloyl-ACP methyl ester carboxylesterase